MRELFPGYYRPTEKEFEQLWQEGLFILDTNVLLNLYRYDEDSRNDFIGTLERIQDRLWLPHQVALEFQENRVEVVKSEERRLESIQSALERIRAESLKELKQFPSINADGFLNKLDKVSEEFIAEIEPFMSKQLRSNEYDYIRDKIDNLLKGKIGKPPDNQQELDQIYEEGKKRYSIKWPPGFKDEVDKKKLSPYLYEKMTFRREYGDLLIWKQILKEIQSRKRKYIVFVTDDDKEDWWRIEKGQTIGARPELVKEIFDSGALCFHMYSSERFLFYAKQYLEVDIKDESIRRIESTVAKYHQRNLKTNETYVVNNELFALVPFGNWLDKKYPEDKIVPDKYFDFLKVSDSCVFAYDVKLFPSSPAKHFAKRSFISLSRRIKEVNGINRFYLAIIVNRLSKKDCNIFINLFDEVFGNEDENEIGRNPLGQVYLLIGMIVSEMDSQNLSESNHSFVPVYSTDPEISSRFDS